MATPEDTEATEGSRLRWGPDCGGRRCWRVRGWQGRGAEWRSPVWTLRSWLTRVHQLPGRGRPSRAADGASSRLDPLPTQVSLSSTPSSPESLKVGDKFFVGEASSRSRGRGDGPGQRTLCEHSLALGCQPMMPLGGCPTADTRSTAGRTEPDAPSRVHRAIRRTRCGSAATGRSRNAAHLEAL